MEAILANVGAWLAFFADRAFQSMSAVMSDMRFFLQRTLQGILTSLDGAFRFIGEQVNKLGDAMEQAIQFIFRNATAMINFAVSQLVDVAVGAVDSVRKFAENTFSKLNALIGGAIRDIQGFIGFAMTQIQALASLIFRTVQDFAFQTAAKVNQQIEALTGGVSSLITETTAALDQGIQALVGTADSLVGSIETRLSDLRGAFGEAAAELVSAISITGSELKESVESQVRILMSELVSFAEPNQVVTMIEDINRLTRSNADPVEMKAWLDGAWRRFAPTRGVWATVFFALVSILGQVFLFADAARINSQIMLQGLALQFPFQLLTPGDAVNALNRGFVSEEQALNLIRRQGYSEELSRILIRLADTFPQEQELFRAWHRGLLNEQQIDLALKSLNRPAEYIEASKHASFPLPPVGDLITMAVREVFTPAVAERFGQFEDFPPEFAAEAEKQGLTKEWSQRYWAAHWALPSPSQGFEMLHRGIIGEQDLNLLLRALDVMPFWRERLTQIAFAPFTRVDIRRMHKMGVLTKEEVNRAYHDIGYDDDKAAKLTEFTIQLNREPAADDEADLKILSRSQVLTFFGDGLVSLARATELLSAMGYTGDAIGLMLSEVELTKERAERKAEIQLTLDLAKAKVITLPQAEDRLNRIGLETVEVSRAISELVREAERRTKLPTRAEAETFFRAKIISEDDYKDVLETIGFSDKWVKAYIAEAKKG